MRDIKCPVSERINGPPQHKNLNGCLSGTPKQEQSCWLRYWYTKRIHNS